MKKSDNPRNTSRRSFIKKSVVASVAASNLTMFSGLVNATGSHGSGSSDSDCKLKSSRISCKIVFEEREFTDSNGTIETHYIPKHRSEIYSCWVTGEPTEKCKTKRCVDDLNGDVNIPCGSDRDDTDAELQCEKIRVLSNQDIANSAGASQNGEAIDCTWC